MPSRLPSLSRISKPNWTNVGVSSGFTKRRELNDLTMLIGPGQAARLLEIGVAEAEGVEFIVHAMAARPKFLET